MRYTVLILLSYLFVLSSCSSTVNVQGTTPDGTITYQTFYDDLSPYGNWIDYPGYGHVWSPGIDGDFRPYATNGHWVYSNEGWMWNSYYNWGWAPFHYGRWLYDDGYGWLWVPGYDWSPAWVTWGAVDNYYCWAPLGPGVGVGAAYGGWRPHSNYWNVVPRGNIYDPHISGMIQHPGNGELVNRISVIDNFNRTSGHNNYYSRGPEVGEVQRYTGRTITPMAIQENRQRGNAVMEGNNVRVYRPQVQNPQPRQFRSMENNSPRPMMQMEERPMIQRTEQIRNVNSLPMRTAPMIAFPSGGGRIRR